MKELLDLFIELVNKKNANYPNTYPLFFLNTALKWKCLTRSTSVLMTENNSLEIWKTRSGSLSFLKHIWWSDAVKLVLIEWFVSQSILLEYFSTYRILSEMISGFGEWWFSLFCCTGVKHNWGSTVQKISVLCAVKIQFLFLNLRAVKGQNVNQICIWCATLQQHQFSLVQVFFRYLAGSLFLLQLICGFRLSQLLLSLHLIPD